MLYNGADIIIEKHRPYPDIIYTLTKTNPLTEETLIFNFALQGRDTVVLTGQATDYGLAGCCYNSYDNTAQANAIEEICLSKQDTTFSNEECIKPGFSSFSDSSCDGEECKDCESTWDYNDQDYSGPKRKHGESWCVYDGPVGKGLDYVGSRHYKHACINGDLKSTRLNSSHIPLSRMPSSA